jgi:DNA-binding NarL/FixJ family response regulator
MKLDDLQQGRASFARQAWSEAYAQLSAADRRAQLEPEDLERLAMAACLLGSDAESDEFWTRAHQEFLNRGDSQRAARSAFWLAFGLLNRGEHARAGGWLGRAARLLPSADCVEHGYLLFPEALQRVFGGDNVAAYGTFRDAAEIGERFGDPDLTALARHGQGRALIRQGKVDEGVALLDEAMAAVEAGEVSALAAGNIYCSVIEACHEIFDLRRAREWTGALSLWCESQPDLVPYRGQCLVRRAEILQIQGDWPDAMAEAERACDWLTRPPPQAAAGAAFYQRAELQRLRGDFTAAEESYRQASQRGRNPQPGLALLRLVQGQIDAAEAAIRRALDEAREPRVRYRLLPAYLEIMLSARDIEAASAAADELAEIADEIDTPVLRAAADQGRGAVLLARSDPQSALAALRPAWHRWRELDAMYEAARVQVLIGLACRGLGDEDSARMEFHAAASAFQQLGAKPDSAHLEQLGRTPSLPASDALTPRELEVLRLVAAGKTNRSIATELFISERTVHRHVSNIFMKLGLSSRSAATAYAYEQDLVSPS